MVGAKMIILAVIYASSAVTDAVDCGGLFIFCRDSDQGVH